LFFAVCAMLASGATMGTITDAAPAIAWRAISSEKLG
jgi:hypothetical protein